MKCVFLAAGYATRMYPLTRDFPKPLLEVAGKPILEWLTDDLMQSRLVDGFVVVSNHRFYPLFSAWAGDRPITVLDDGTASNETRLGAVRDLALAVRHLDGRDDLLVAAGDNLLDFSLAEFIRFAAEKQTSCVMCYEEPRAEALRRTAVVTVNSRGEVLSFQEKPAEPLGNLAVPPFYIYKRADADRIPEALEGGCAADSPGSFAAWLSSRAVMHAFRMPGSRYDVGDLQGYQALRTAYGGPAGRRSSGNGAAGA